MTNYVTELATRSSPAYIAAAVRDTKTLLGTYGTWIEKYRGGIPAGWAAAIMNWESGGNFNAPGDPSLGEVGFYQVAAYVPGTLGMPAEARLDPETNVFLGLMEYQLEVAKWKAMFPALVKIASDDAWKLARLSFSVGWGGATGLAKLAQGRALPGRLYDAIAAHVTEHGGTQLGSQSPDQVWFRVLSIAPQWEVGRQAGSLLAISGPPTIVPAPPKYPYTLPLPYAMMFEQPTSWLAIGAIGVAAFALWRLTQ